MRLSGEKRGTRMRETEARVQARSHGAPLGEASLSEEKMLITEERRDRATLPAGRESQQSGQVPQRV
jgi:hypothetical protein